MISDWKDKKIAVLGFGVEGLSTIRFLHKAGIPFSLLEKRRKEELDASFYSEAEGLGARFVLGEDYLNSLSQYDIIIRSPGIKLSTPEIVQAQKNGVVITSQTKLFFTLCPCPIIGVTGTKGKGTTASLIYEMLKKAEKDAYLGGNVGIPPLDFLEKLESSSWVVLELSSFQLQDLERSPHIGVLLMLTSEHLDYHKDVYEYINAKRNMLRNQTSEDFAIINRDYPASCESDIHTEGKVFYVSRERESEEGCFKRDNAIWLRINGVEKKIINREEVLLPGMHNLENICAAVLAASLAGVSLDEMRDVLKVFKGLEHRLEVIREVNGVRYYDDSFSTTPETVIAAIESFASPEILILGGSSKNSDFAELGKVIGSAKNIKAIIGIGEEWKRIKAELKITNQTSNILFVEGATTMHQIVQAASKIAQQGDVVLLSPGCASFGMFKNYKERGEQFKKEVQSLSF
jgi:UDP-N-acetylmuramoylalanine--D-glutamate ligase